MNNINKTTFLIIVNILIAASIYGAAFLLFYARDTATLDRQLIELLKLDPSKEKLEKPMNLWCIQLPENVKIKEDK